MPKNFTLSLSKWGPCPITVLGSLAIATDALLNDIAYEAILPVAYT